MRLLVVPLAAAVLAGCASRESPIPLNTYQAVAAPQPGTPAVPVTATADYRINQYDELRVSVFGESDLTLDRLPVSPDGTISVPLAGTIVAEGRTTAELSREIAAALNRYLRDPKVSVNVTQYTSQKITIEGAVKLPGVFQSSGPVSLMDAIALGQGLGDYSKQSEILVFRRQGGRRYVARFDLSMIQAGTAVDPEILPGDVVVVGFSNAHRLFTNALAVLPAAVGIFIALIN